MLHECMKLHISQGTLTDELKKKIFDGFGQQAIEATGINGLAEAPISFEIFDGTHFAGAIVVQPFWGQLHIKYLFVEKKYRGQGLARQLMHHALTFGEQRGCQFAFVETMNFQAPDFYKKFGFCVEFCRSGYANNTTFYYLKKSLKPAVSLESPQQITRIGVYGVIMNQRKMLLIRQQKGPYAGKLDFPGGGIEFGETVEQALRRELTEEVSMVFDRCHLIDNLTTTVDILQPHKAAIFYQIGMIYRIDGCRPINEGQTELESLWVDPMTLQEEHCSRLLWKYRTLLEGQDIH